MSDWLRLARHRGADALIEAPNEGECTMSILSSIGRIATGYSAARIRYRTERALRSLPLDLRKDIGWPEADDFRESRRYGIAARAGAR